MDLKTKKSIQNSSYHKLLVLMIGVLIAAYKQSSFIIHIHQELVYNLLFSIIVLPSILYTIFSKSKSGTSIHQSSKSALLIILSFTAMLFYVSTFLGICISTIIIAFHFGDNDLRIKDAYLWKLLYGIGFIGVLISSNWVSIIEVLFDNHIINTIQNIELGDMQKSIMGLQFPFSTLFTLSIVMAYLINKNTETLFHLIWLPLLLSLPAFWSIALYLFIYRPINDITENDGSIPFSRTLIFLLIGSSIGIITFYYFQDSSFKQSILLTFIGVSFIVPYVVRRHEIINTRYQTKIVKTDTEQQEIKQVKLHTSYRGWENKLLKRIELSQINFKEPNKI